MKWQASLAKWRAVRNIFAPQEGYVKMMLSEMKEHTNAIADLDWHEQVDAINDMLVLTTNQIATEQTKPTEVMAVLNTIEDVEELLINYEFGGDNAAIFTSIEAFCANKLTELGVVKDLAMKQTLKEIMSRKIDPAKEADWNAGKLNKWPKWKEQTDTYKANYDLCRIKKD